LRHQHVLNEVITNGRRMREAIWGQTMEAKDARELSRVDGNAIAAVKADVSARLAAPKIFAAEASLQKMVDASKAA
jgi:hypothetical protein